VRGREGDFESMAGIAAIQGPQSEREIDMKLRASFTAEATQKKSEPVNQAGG
jgi:hypothetical protein